MPPICNELDGSAGFLTRQTGLWSCRGVFAVDAVNPASGLSDKEAHVWLVDVPTADRLAACHDGLSASELEAALALKPSTRQSQRIVGWHARRHLLGRYLRCSPAELEFTTDTQGKPILTSRENAATSLHFSTAYCGRHLAMAVCASSPVGVDLEEEHEFEFESFVEMHFSASERRDWHALPNRSAQTQALFRIWTLKEAFLKATGVGLNLAPHSITFSHLPSASPVLSAVDGDREATSRWRFAAWRTPGALAVAAAVSAEILTIKTARYVIP